MDTMNKQISFAVHSSLLLLAEFRCFWVFECFLNIFPTIFYLKYKLVCWVIWPTISSANISSKMSRGSTLWTWFETQGVPENWILFIPSAGGSLCHFAFRYLLTVFLISFIIIRSSTFCCLTGWSNVNERGIFINIISRVSGQVIRQVIISVFDNNFLFSLRL